MFLFLGSSPCYIIIMIELKKWDDIFMYKFIIVVDIRSKSVRVAFLYIDNCIVEL
jgi:hypothetical protein